MSKFFIELEYKDSNMDKTIPFDNREVAYSTYSDLLAQYLIFLPDKTNIELIRLSSDNSTIEEHVFEEL